MLNLNTLIKNSGYSDIQIEYPLQEIPIEYVTQDSRDVRRNSLYVAVRGDSVDGHQFISQAIESGAVAVLGERHNVNIPVPYLRSANSREALAFLSAALYGFPSRELTVIGVTGTDGKTTTVNLIYHMLQSCGIPVGMISTVNAVIGDKEYDTGFHVTTPDAPTVQKLLREMVENGMTHVILETTSHGLDQHRVSACDIDIGVITNITHEHLDYHGNYENYLMAKAKLLTGLSKHEPKARKLDRFAVINCDDESYMHLVKILKNKQHQSINILSYGKDNIADVIAADVKQNEEGLNFTVDDGEHKIPVHTSLIGEYNIYNITAAMTVALRCLKLPKNCTIAGLRRMPGISGRMERIHMGQSFTAIVDFAHTPNALEVALKTARKLTSERLISVFGSAGLRDKAKRRMMAAVSMQLSDITILTAEDPRTEDLSEILREMAEEARGNGGVEGKNFFCVPDRGEAIYQAVSMAKQGDLVIACGKGHEQSMCFGTTEYPWDDRVAMRAALSQLLNQEGVKMPYLPTQEKRRL